MAKKKFLVLAATSIDGVLYPCGTVINIDKAVGDNYAAAGALDGTPDASSHAIANGAEVIEHAVASAPTPADTPAAE